MFEYKFGKRWYICAMSPTSCWKTVMKMYQRDGIECRELEA